MLLKLFQNKTYSYAFYFEDAAQVLMKDRVA